jgi:hypothetical protein
MLLYKLWREYAEVQAEQPDLPIFAAMLEVWGRSPWQKLQPCSGTLVGSS